ncbi:MAG: iron-siderophore ABC transporter substrate-binding protein [Acidimicrobiales bacterium]
MRKPGRRRTVVATLTLALVAAGCGGTGSDADTTSGAEGQDPVVDGSAFPVTIEHKYGSTVISAEPERVVSLGFQEHDAILALGVTPVAVRYWYGPEDDVIYPWAEEAARGAEPEILVMPELNVEAVAAVHPDLILGVYSGITEIEYEQLSEIAPTVAQTDEYVDYGVPWQDMTLTAGRALGRLERAEELVNDLEGRFADLRAEHPAFEGKSVAVATYGADNIGFFASDDPRSRFFRSLGFEVPAELDTIAGELFYGELSYEQAELLDRDLLVWDQLSFTVGGRATVEADPLVAQLAAMQEERALFLEGELESAFGWSTVLSLPFVLDAILPLLEEAMGTAATS